MKGSVVVLVVPVNTPRHVWYPDEAQTIFDDACRARRRLEEEAKVNGQNLKIFVALQLGETPILNAPRAGLDLPTLLATTIGQDSLTRFCDNLKRSFGFEQVAVLLAEHGRRPSHAIPCTSAVQQPYEEVIRCFYRPEKSRLLENPSITIAHELLHLFGAMDLYDFLPDDPVVGAWVRSSLMGPTIDPLEELVVDPLTAYLIGWRATPDPAWEAVFGGSPMRVRKSAYR